MAVEINRAMDPEKFAKVLAMAESDHHGEAQSALRAARIMLARAGLTFRDLAAMARESDGWPLPPAEQAAFVPTNVPGAGEETWRRKVRELEARIRELENTVETQDAELIRQGREVLARFDPVIVVNRVRTAADRNAAAPCAGSARPGHKRSGHPPPPPPLVLRLGAVSGNAPEHVPGVHWPLRAPLT